MRSLIEKLSSNLEPNSQFTFNVFWLKLFSHSMFEKNWSYGFGYGLRPKVKNVATVQHWYFGMFLISYYDFNSIFKYTTPSGCYHATHQPKNSKIRIKQAPGTTISLQQQLMYQFCALYSCNNITTTLIQISRLFYFCFFSKTI